jgi:hypothetical protein
MDLKETTYLLNSVDMNVVTPLERNNSDKPSVYGITSSAEEEKDDNSSDSNHSDTNREGRKFSNVSTLDWLQTWRSTAIS